MIGILQVVIATKKSTTLADDFLCADAVLFLSSCILSYWALRTRSSCRMYRVERFADTVFLLALMFMAFICIFITYEITSAWLGPVQEKASAATHTPRWHKVVVVQGVPSATEMLLTAVHVPVVVDTHRSGPHAASFVG